MNMKRIKYMLLVLTLLLCNGLCACSNKPNPEPKKISLLMLPHFETDEMTGDFPGEAQLFYEGYLAGGETYELAGGYALYYNPENRVAMCVTGSGKVNTTASLTAVLCDSRFDCADTYIMGIGCAGGAIGYATLGDVCLATAVCDNDLGHTSDPRDMEDTKSSKWYHDPSYDDVSYKVMNKELVRELYDVAKNVPLQTTDLSREIMRENFGDAEWATRDPKLILGTLMSSDNYWKGMYDHEKADDIAEYYQTEHPYAMTEMEDIAIADVAENFGLLDRTFLIRCSVNTDVFMNGSTPESVWGDVDDFSTKTEKENEETLDIFEPAMHNNYAIGSAMIDHLLAK